MNADIREHSNFKHGLTEHSLYGVWISMRYRCHSSHSQNESWNGKGITVCPEWKEFLPFYEWAISNGYKKGLTLDRIDNDGDYKPSNCRFTTWSVQNSNKGERRSMPRPFLNRRILKAKCYKTQYICS